MENTKISATDSKQVYSPVPKTKRRVWPANQDRGRQRDSIFHAKVGIWVSIYGNRSTCKSSASLCTTPAINPISNMHRAVLTENAQVEQDEH